MMTLEEYEEQLENTCHAGYVPGLNGDAESFGTDCDQPAGHYPATKHEGPCPFGTDQRVSWEGGGFCAGDPLPYRNVEYIG